MHSPKSAKPDRRRQRRTSGQLIAKSISIKDAKRRSGGCAPKAVELTPGGLSRVAPRRLRRSRGRLTAGQKSAEGIVGQPLQGTATPWRAEVPRRGCRRLADGFWRMSGHPASNRPCATRISTASVCLARVAAIPGAAQTIPRADPVCSFTFAVTAARNSRCARPRVPGNFRQTGDR